MHNRAEGADAQPRLRRRCLVAPAEHRCDASLADGGEDQSLILSRHQLELPQPVHVLIGQLRPQDVAPSGKPV